MAAPPIVALELGTTKVTALVGELREDDLVMISGSGECPSKGIRKGEVTDAPALTECIRTALEAAEATGKVTIRQVILAVSGAGIRGLVNRGSIPVMKREGVIEEDDVEQVRQVARALNLPPEREILHSISRHFSVDEHEFVLRPEGMAGARLSHEMLIVHGLRSRMEAGIRAVQAVPMNVADVVFGGIGAASAVLTPEQRRSGVLVLDIGGGTTDIVVYRANVLADAGVIAVGGDHVTNDIAVAFNISASQAERLKRESAGAIPGSATTRAQRISLAPEIGFPGRSVNLYALNMVVNARMDELFRLVRSRLEETDSTGHLGAGVVLTGGGAHLKEAAELAEEVFELPCTVGVPRGVTGIATVTDGPEYATCVGVVQYGFKALEEQRGQPVLGRVWKRIFRRSH